MFGAARSAPKEGRGYPRIYRPAPERIAARCIGGALLIVGGLFATPVSFGLIAGQADLESPYNIFIFAPPIALAILGVCVIVDALLQRIVLHEDSLEWHGLRTEDVLWRSDAPPNPPQMRRVEQAIEQWRSTLHLEAEEIAVSTEPGSSPNQPLWSLGAMAFGGAAAIAAYGAAGVILLIGPLLQFLVPWKLGKLYSGRFSGGSTAMIAIGCAMSLAPYSIKLRGTTQMMMLACAIAVSFYVLYVLAALAMGAGRPATVPVAMMAAASLVAAYSTAILANAAYDKASATVYRAPLTQKFLTRGNKGKILYNLRLAPSEAEPEGVAFLVDIIYYESVKVGDPFCIAVHPGALGVEWSQLNRCP